MSVDIYFFIEVQDADGKWHLVKWYADGEFDKEDPTEWDFEKVVDFNGKRMVEKYEFWPGLAWRDEIGWARNFNGLSVRDSLPNGLSSELDALITEHGEREKSRRAPLYGDDYEYDYRRHYGTLMFSEMVKHSNEKFEEWKTRLKDKIKDEQLEEINKRIDNLEKIALGKTDKPFKQRKIEKEYEDTIEYYLDDALFDVIALKRENNEVYDKAVNFTGDRWFDENKIRVIYYFN